MLVPYLTHTSVPLVSSMKMERVMASLTWGDLEPLCPRLQCTLISPHPPLMRVLGGPKQTVHSSRSANLETCQAGPHPGAGRGATDRGAAAAGWESGPKWLEKTPLASASAGEWGLGALGVGLGLQSFQV